MKKLSFILCLLLLVPLGCSRSERTQLPAPAALFDEISTAAQLPAMTDVAADFLETDTGIDPAACDGAVYFLLELGTAPDEIIIVRAKTEADAADIMTRLENRLAYKEESAQVYLTEYLPMIQNGVVRRDGLTVSLIVSDQMEAILKVYDNYQ